jgi:hypothetical protein
MADKTDVSQKLHTGNFLVTTLGKSFNFYRSYDCQICIKYIYFSDLVFFK